LVIFWSILAAMAGQAALLVSGPVVARLLGVEHRGYLALFMLIPALVAQIAHLGLPEALPYHLAGDIRRLAGVARAIRRPVVVQAALATCLGGLVVVRFAWGEPGGVQLAGLLSVPMVVLVLALSYAYAILLGLHRFARFQLIRLLPPTLYAVGASCLLLLGVHSLVAVMSACLLSQFAAVVIVAFILPRAPLDSNPDGPTTGVLMRFGLRGWLGTTTPIEGLRLQNGGPGGRAGLDRLEGGHQPAGALDRAPRRGGYRPGDPNVAAEQRQGAELAQRRAPQPRLRGGRVRLGLVDQVQARPELAGPEAAGPGQQCPGRGQVGLDQQGLVPGMPGEQGSTGHDQAEQQRDQQTSKHEPPLAAIRTNGANITSLRRRPRPRPRPCSLRRTS
jgi:hypothetical protein